jgi:hypothetical protein
VSVENPYRPPQDFAALPTRRAYASATRVFWTAVAAVWAANLVLVPFVASVLEKSEENPNTGVAECVILLLNLPGIPGWIVSAPCVLPPAWLDVPYFWWGFKAHILLAGWSSVSWGLIAMGVSRLIPIRMQRSQA